MIKTFLNETLKDDERKFKNTDDAFYFIADYFKSLKIANSKRIFDEMDLLLQSDKRDQKTFEIVSSGTVPADLIYHMFNCKVHIVLDIENGLKKYMIF